MKKPCTMPLYCTVCWMKFQLVEWRVDFDQIRPD